MVIHSIWLLLVRMLLFCGAMLCSGALMSVISYQLSVISYQLSVISLFELLAYILLGSMKVPPQV